MLVTPSLLSLISAPTFSIEHQTHQSISLITGVISTQLIQLITNLLITQPYPAGIGYFCGQYWLSGALTSSGVGGAPLHAILAFTYVISLSKKPVFEFQMQTLPLLPSPETPTPKIPNPRPNIPNPRHRAAWKAHPCTLFSRRRSPLAHKKQPPP